MIGRSELRKKKTKQQHLRRFQCKRKRSLISLPSTSSIASNSIDEDCVEDNCYGIEQCKLSSVDDLTSTPSFTCMTTCTDTDFEFSSNTENDSLIDESISTSVSSNDDSSDDESNDSNDIYSRLPDHRPLYSVASTTVYQFSLDILEFSRMSRLPRNQRAQLLDLFRKYLPSPNFLPKSCDELFSKLSIQIVSQS